MTPLQWSKKDLLSAWNEEKAIKEKTIAERDALRVELQREKQKVSDVDLKARELHALVGDLQRELKRTYLALVAALIGRQ